MNDKTFRDREILQQAHEKGTGATLLAFLRLSGPGWLQSAITLGGGSLVGALYLGMLAGTSMLWLQLVAIAIGVIMLSAIAYVTLSTNVRPYQAINDYVNPVLGVGWVGATILANMIWIIPQFGLCYDALDRSLLVMPPAEVAELEQKLADVELQMAARDSAPVESLQAERDALKEKLELGSHGLGASIKTKAMVSGVIALVAFFMVVLSFNPGWMATTFDLILKLIVGMVVVCFVVVVYILATNGSLDFREILMGFIPDLSQWSRPAASIEALLLELDGSVSGYWEEKIVSEQRQSMIGVTATAVGLNMTFLLPYSLLARGWDKTFRGLSRSDLVMAMAIPYLLVTTCIVIASAHAFHAKADAEFLSTDPVVMQQSVLFDSTAKLIEGRYLEQFTDLDVRKESQTQLNADVDAAQKRLDEFEGSDEDRKPLEAELKQAQAKKKQQLAEFAAALPEAEKRIIPTLIKPNARQLASTLKPMLGEKYEGYNNLIFGLGALGMGFSTIIILSLINGYAFAEITGQYNSTAARTIGAVLAIAVGFAWFWIWQGESRTWLTIVASSFGAILLPIAYIAFFALMNSRRLLGDQIPTGWKMVIWNVLMAIGVAGALLQAGGAIMTKISDPQTGPFVIGGVCVFIFLALVGFSARRVSSFQQHTQSNDG